MSNTLRSLGAALALVALCACGLTPDPPPEFPPEAYGGMGREMAKCMAYASESYCEKQTWGGDER